MERFAMLLARPAWTEQHALQFLLRMERLQRRRLARPLRRQRFRAQESLSQQRRWNIYGRRGAGGRRRCRRGHGRQLVRLRQRRRRRPLCCQHVDGRRRAHRGAGRSFKKNAPGRKSRARYRKHAMGNSLFRNDAARTVSRCDDGAGVGMGRWAWSSDAWDFDHDGFADLYVTNGMVSGPSARQI